MKRIPFIFAAILAMACLFSCKSKEKYIPREDMAQIFADIFISDQWLRSDIPAYKAADSSMYYESIFVRHGYTTEDFRNSIYHYLGDPNRFVKVLRLSAEILEDKHKRLDAKYNEEVSISSEIEKLIECAPEVPVFYDSLFFASAAGFHIRLEKDEMGVYVPDFLLPENDSVPPARSSSESFLDRPSKFRMIGNGNLEKHQETVEQADNN